jgi:hypothetical protein
MISPLLKASQLTNSATTMPANLSDFSSAMALGFLSVEKQISPELQA